MVDTHCHLFASDYDDIDEVVERAISHNVNMIIVNGTNSENNREVLSLIKKYDIIYGALGIQPEEISENYEEDLKFIEEHINDDKVVAVGEIGLDYHYECDRELQKKVFRRQLELAQKYNKPVIIHSRDCIKETYDILKEYRVFGIMHCYSGSVEMAREFNKLGFYLGIGGICTFKNASKIVDVIKEIDLEYIVLETDSPYLAPEPYRGHRNEPMNIDIIMHRVSEIKGIDCGVVSDVIGRNIIRLFDKNSSL